MIDYPHTTNKESAVAQSTRGEPIKISPWAKGIIEAGAVKASKKKGRNVTRIEMLDEIVEFWHSKHANKS